MTRGQDDTLGARRHENNESSASRGHHLHPARSGEKQYDRRAPMKKPPATQERPAAGRRGLLDAAAQEFAELGFAGATTVGIARRAGVTQPLVHHHFGSKEGLWAAVTDELFGELRTALEHAAAAQRGASRRERLSAIMRALVDFCGRSPQLARLLRTEARRGGKPFEQLYRQWLEGLVKFFRKEIAAAAAEGAVRRVDPAFLYFILVGAAIEPFSQPETARRAFALDVSDPDAIARYADTLVDVMLRGILQK
jgi:TetR/AcrR family transcriptional regulator